MRASLGAIIGRFPFPNSSNGAQDQTQNQTLQLGDVIRHGRKCRDIPFLVFFIVFWIAFIVNSSFGFYKGNPLRLTHGLDYKGNVCGDQNGSPNLRGLGVRYWVNPNQVFESGFKDTHSDLEDFKSICLKDCPVPSDDTLKWVCNYPEGDDIRLSMDQWVSREYDYFSFLTPDMRKSSLQLLGPCYPVLFPSVNVLWSCEFMTRKSNASLQQWHQMGGQTVDDGMKLDKTVHKSINSESSVLKRYVADIGKAWPVLIVCGGIIPLILSVIFLAMIQRLVTAMTWITVVLVDILIISVTIFFYLKAGWIGNDAISPIIGNHDPYYDISGRERGHLHFFAVLMTIIMAVAILSSIAIARRIVMAASVLKVASKIIGEVRALIIFPVMPYALLSIFYMIWITSTLYILSSGHVIRDRCNANCCAYDLRLKQVNCERCCGHTIHYTPHIGLAILFHLFGWYWVTQFVKAFSSTVIAGSVASHYWGHGEILQEISFFPIFSSMKRLVRYNIGSVAVGSLIVSIVESSSRLLKPLRRKLVVVDVSTHNWVGKVLSVSSHYALVCIEWIIRSVNHNAYIMIAITGESFFASSAMATELIKNNILRIGKVNVIGNVILFLGKLCVSLASALFAFLMLDTHTYKSSHNKVSSPLIPVLVCLGLGFVVATLFFSVVEVTIDTIILSYCQDSEEEHRGTTQYATPLLMETNNINHNETDAHDE
ncbi:choline transporter protein 1-like [Rutidosis leptorrhynchoides]|uniref:choline transporter protein 1-like n=1 Tax=Rutidosis leptorrhynchoides TaxID=125765 RepID=UPI003A9A2F25